MPGPAKEVLIRRTPGPSPQTYSAPPWLRFCNAHPALLGDREVGQNPPQALLAALKGPAGLQLVVVVL